MGEGESTYIDQLFNVGVDFSMNIKTDDDSN